MDLPTDRESAQWTLATVLELAARLDRGLEQTDAHAGFLAETAERLSTYATSLGRDLRLVALGRRIREHLISQHGARVPPVDSLDVWNWQHLHAGRHTVATYPAPAHHHQADELGVGWAS